MKISVFWFRRDLRTKDNAGLFHALTSSQNPVLPLFIFDKDILTGLPKHDARVTFIYDAIETLHRELKGQLKVAIGTPSSVFKQLASEYEIETVYTNTDYEPKAIERDDTIAALLESKGAELKQFKDHVIFEKLEICKKDGSPYTVFTPYKKRWLAEMQKQSLAPAKSFSSRKHLNKIASLQFPLPTLESIGFTRSDLAIPPPSVPRKLIKGYEQTRDYPALNGTSRLGIHFRFGTISIREKVRGASELSSVYLSELIWRDFYSQILANFPHVAKEAFRAKYRNIPWKNDKEEFRLWCEGTTGYPLVDAGMRELNQTGHMHNRVRMVTASFLTKHLLIDWRWGEAYFASKLLDFDLASNNGGWQWAAGCGTDAAPYFRIFNPALQLKRFDKEKIYVKKWVPEHGTDSYPAPIVDHPFARQRCLEVYKTAINLSDDL